jgi:hypothetical protein
MTATDWSSWPNSTRSISISIGTPSEAPPD